MVFTNFQEHKLIILFVLFFFFVVIIFLGFFKKKKKTTENSQKKNQKLVPRSLTLESVGLKIEYVERGETHDTTIVFIHGYTDSWFSFSRVMKFMDNENYHCIYLTLRGHGNSGRTEDYEIRSFADDVANFMNQKGIEKAILVGHSMGTFISQRVAITHPEKVESLVLIGSAASCNKNPVLSGLNSDVQKLEDPIDREFVSEFQTSTVASKLPDKFMNRIIDESLKLNSDTWKKTLSGLIKCDYQSQLKEMNKQVLILWGDKDEVFPEDDQKILNEVLDQSMLKVYKNTGHGLHWEKPEKFVKDLTHFIQKTKKDK
ncbi:cis-3-alkyl-4-alkyloxetan-2-one decarboxylase [Anaeramoeba flamelloides]|uniref:Cis-3-alkyl-4-alkyloxetan-2-one decarboxylase n=1 Tax=Anaeramoeba flamelloides TaxID=1746091 RepID=A0ABQ8XS00_9EUKA|nr:cis-3-alkyl-4-alkyloxetan-2-one decarboxylase [Anaeramoeba flamelloides]